jgi:hypothetical protein
MAEIKFFANLPEGTSQDINVAAGSGLGFYGSDYGVAVAIGAQQSKTFITNSTGTATDEIEINNTAMTSIGEENVEEGTVSINRSVTPIKLSALPNYLCPLNIRFTHTTAVATQNAKIRIFDRDSIDNAATGVTTYLFEARHPAPTQDENLTLEHRISDGGFYWTEFNPDEESAGQEMILTNSPGALGKNELENVSTSEADKTLYNITSNNGSNHQVTQHDWYVAISCEPEEVGSQLNYGLYFTVEYV